MINVNDSFLEGYEYALRLVQKGLSDMYEYDTPDEKTIDLVRIYVDGLSFVQKALKESKDGVQ